MAVTIIKILTGLFFIVSLYFVAWDRASAESSDTKITKPDYPKYKKPELPDFNKSIPKPDYIKYKPPELPDLNKDLKIAPADHTLYYFNMGLHYEKVGRIKDAIESYKKFITFSPPNKNTLNINYAKERVSELEKIDSGSGKKR